MRLTDGYLKPMPVRSVLYAAEIEWLLKEWQRLPTCVKGVLENVAIRQGTADPEPLTTPTNAST
jgi:hypothetical protein